MTASLEQLTKSKAVFSPAHVLIAAQEFVETWMERLMPPRTMAPQRLHSAMQDAVFPGGRRARPLLCRLVADLNGGGDEELVGRTAAAIEMVHCASLVQDDLPCFDGADMRRGRPSCHAAYGEATAILVGDALLTLAFETLAKAPSRHGATVAQLVAILAKGTGSAHGIIGGQSLELEKRPISVDEYHLQKTAALFRAASAAGALCAGAKDIARWERFGELMGVALQLRDDLDDADTEAPAIDKPRGKDQQLGRPNAVLARGAESTRRTQGALVREMLDLLGPVSRPVEALHLLIQEVTRPSKPISA